jgi:hypothetical protein
MPRKDKDVPPPIDEIKDILDKDMECLELPMFAVEGLLDLEERPVEVAGLYFLSLIHLKKHGTIPSTDKFSEMGCGSGKRLARIRKVAKEYGWMEDIYLRKENKIVARRIKLTSPKLKNIRDTLNAQKVNLTKGAVNIINNINTPDSERTESGCVCSSCSCSKEKETPIKFPREQDFNALWSINRRKINKDKARKQWKSKPTQKALPPKDVLLKAYEADAQRNKWDEADEKYVPHLSTWLSEKRWKNYTGEPKGEGGGIHIMDQLRKSDGIESPRELREAILDAMEARDKVRPKGMVRPYVKWLKGPDSPPATSRDSLKDVLITDRTQSRYWDAYVEADQPGMTKTEEF